MGGIISYIFALLMVIAGSRDHGDMLDAIATDTYWQLKNVTPDTAQLLRDAAPAEPAPSLAALEKDLQSEDFATRDRARRELEGMGPSILPQLKPLADSKDDEVAAAAQGLIQKFSERSQERAVRRLMAIRTLGERKEASALPLLDGMTNSTDLFVAAYARRAIAQIKGEQMRAMDLSARFSDDLALLPAESGMVAQTVGINPQRLTVARLTEQALLMRSGDMPPDAPKVDAREMTLDASRQLLLVLERVGNMRIDGVSVSFQYVHKKEEVHGWFIAVIRGEYDPVALFPALRSAMGSRGKATPAEKPGDVAMISEEDGEYSLLLPSSDRAIFVTAPNGDEGTAARDKMLAMLKTPPVSGARPAILQNADLAPLLKEVDTQSPFWLAGKFDESIVGEVFDGAFSRLTITTKATAEGADFVLKAGGENAEKVKAAVSEVQSGLKSSAEEVRQEAARVPAAKVAADFLAGIKCTGDEQSMTLSGNLPGSILTMLMGQLPMSGLVELVRPPAQDVVEPVPAQDAIEPAPAQ